MFSHRKVERDEIALGLDLQWEIGDYCAHIFAETWFHLGILTFSTDRAQESSGIRGGGLYVCINDAWS